MIPWTTTLREVAYKSDALPIHKALYIAVCSLERIAGKDSPEGGSERIDAVRNLDRIGRLLTPPLPIRATPRPLLKQDANSPDK